MPTIDIHSTRSISSVLYDVIESAIKDGAKIKIYFVGEEVPVYLDNLVSVLTFIEGICVVNGQTTMVLPYSSLAGVFVER